MSSATLLEWSYITRKQFNRLLIELSIDHLGEEERWAFFPGHADGCSTAMLLLDWECPAAFQMFYLTKLHQACLRTGIRMPAIKAWDPGGKAGSAPEDYGTAAPFVSGLQWL